MSKRTELIAKYAEDLKSKCKIIPDLSLLEKVTIGCGPAIYSADSETLAASDPAELETVKKNFLIKKLGLPDSPKLTEALNASTMVDLASAAIQALGSISGAIPSRE